MVVGAGDCTRLMNGDLGVVDVPAAIQVELSGACPTSGAALAGRIRNMTGRLGSVVEQRFCKPQVVGSIPTGGSRYNHLIFKGFICFQGIENVVCFFTQIVAIDTRK